MSARSALFGSDMKIDLAIIAVAAVLFIILSLPATYNLTSKVFKWEKKDDGSVGFAGIAVHGVVFAILLALSAFLLHKFMK